RGRVDAVDRADLDARVVLLSDAGLGDDVGHWIRFDSLSGRRDSRGMLFLTGATGTVGSALLARLTARGEAVRCLVRSPRRLGDQRVRGQIALADLPEPQSSRHALRGVDTVIHLAASARDQPAASIEELNGLATWRLVKAAERAG